MQGVIPTPSSPARKSASGLEEKDGNQQAFYRSRKADVLKDLSKENLPGDIRRNNFLEHAEENGFQFDKRKDLTATMEETGLTAKQIHQLYEKDLIAGDIRYSNGLGDSRARPIPLLEKTPTGLVGMDGSEA